MTSEAAGIDASAPPAGPSVGRKAVAGASWAMLDSLGAKALATVTQVVLAYFLAPDQFGLFAMAFAVVGFAEFASRTGIRDILIRRQSEYDEIGGTAIWMSAALGLLSSAIIALAAPAAARFYENPAVEGVLYLAAASPLITALGIVPKTRLEMQFRYRELAYINWLAAVVRIVVSIGLALAGLGVYALVAGLLAFAAVDSLAFYALTRRPRSMGFSGRAARTVCESMGALYITGLLSAVLARGDYFLLGKFADEVEVGIYFTAFTLGVQVVLMFGTNLGRVLQPALANFGDDLPRQGRAFVSALGLLLMVGVPVCLLQAALAEPLVRAFLPESYAPAALPLAILSAGMTFRLVSFFGVSAIKAQGRFRSLLVLQAVNAAQLLTLAGIGAWLGGAVGCATGMSVGSLGSALLGAAIALRGTTVPLSRAMAAMARPLACGVVAGAAAYLPGVALPDGRAGMIAHLAIGGLLGGGMYVLLIRAFMPAGVREFLARTEFLWTRLPVGRTFAHWIMPGPRPTGGPA